MLEQLNRDFNDGLADAKVESALRRFGLKPEAVSPAELGRRVLADYAAAGEALRRLRIA